MTEIINNTYPIKVTYRKGFSLLFLIMGSVLLITQLSFFFIEEIAINYVGLISSIMIILAGYRYYMGTYFEVEQNKILVKNLHGGTYRKYDFSGLDKLYFDSNKVYLDTKNGTKKLRLSKLMANQDDWNIFKNEINKYDFGKELHEE